MYGHGMQLEIFIDPRHPNRLLMEGPEPTGLRHFALAVDGKLEDEVERLKGLTTEILEFGPIMTDWRGVRFLFVKDPDGLLVELHE